MRKLLPLLLLLAAPAFAQTQNNNGTATGNLTAQDTTCDTPGTTNTPNCVVLNVPGNATVSFQTVGTFSATVTFEATGPAISWVALAVTPSAGGSTVTTANAAGLWTASVSGYTAVRMRVGTYASGTMVATMNSAPGSNFTPAVPGAIGGTTPGAGTFTTLTGTTITGTTYASATNCAANGTAASPSVVSCAASAAGMFSCATNASTATCQVNTTAVTANSEILITQDAADGGASQLNVTCNTGNTLKTTAPLLASKSNGVSFTINLGTVTSNPACFEYLIIN